MLRFMIIFTSYNAKKAHRWGIYSKCRARLHYGLNVHMFRFMIIFASYGA
jgi:hypothetical protein